MRVCLTSLRSLCGVVVRACMRLRGAYEEHGCTLTPWAEWVCRSMACAGSCPGRPFISVRFLTQPVMPIENFPPVILAMSGAPPVAAGGRRVERRKHSKKVINFFK